MRRIAPERQMGRGHFAHAMWKDRPSDNRTAPRARGRRWKGGVCGRSSTASPGCRTRPSEEGSHPRRIGAHGHPRKATSRSLQCVYLCSPSRKGPGQLISATSGGSCRSRQPPRRQRIGWKAMPQCQTARPKLCSTKTRATTLASSPMRKGAVESLSCDANEYVS